MSLIYTTPSDTNNPQQRRNSVYLGGQVEAKSLSTLQRWGVKYILNVTPEKEAGITAGVPNYFEKSPSGFVYKRIPVYDAATSNLLEHADKAVAFISNGLHHGSVLVHCQKGISRSATIVLFYLMRKVGMTLDAAINLCKKRRPIVDPIAPFLLQLEQYENKCRALGILPTVDEGHKSSTTTLDRDHIPASLNLKRKAIGPIMPPTERSDIMSDRPLGLTENEKQEDHVSTLSKELKRKAIGPIMSPAERSELMIDPFTTGNEKQEDGPTPSKSMKRKGIGPALAPETFELVGDPLLNTIDPGLRGSTENESTTVMDTPRMTGDGTNLTTTRFK